jgi:hypothetical protein
LQRALRAAPAAAGTKSADEKREGGFFVKKCLRCGRIEEDSAVYCPSCGDSIFERIEDSPHAGAGFSAAPGIAPRYGDAPRHDEPQPGQAPPYGASQQPPYGASRQPPYNAPPYGPYGEPPCPPRYYPLPAVKQDPVTVGDYLLFALFMIIPVFNLVYLILVAVGGPRYKPSMTNFARAALILLAIGIVISIILLVVLAYNFASLYQYGYFY